MHGTFLAVKLNEGSKEMERQSVRLIAFVPARESAQEQMSPNCFVSIDEKLSL